ncbi:MFS transporter [Actinoallomurus spadix]|uniref:MFS transporter n=1 Tax=Actinoallomurus spadix TaxID=79912 RepID=A0ABN0WGE0_9ACTN|nr:MFS transporter [Actinoallomurus spadix]MCO5989353.1 MFS transporter [Actinoallomurus spadix]
MLITAPPDLDLRHRRGSRGLRRVNLALFAAGLTTFMSLYSTQALLPALSRVFGVSPTASSLLVSLSTGALALAVIPVSSLSEHLGRTRVMLVSSVAAAVLGLLLPLSPSFPVLGLIRAAQGVALAGVPAVAMAYLADEVHPEALGGAMGRYIAGNTIGGLLGRLIPGFVTDLAGWRWALGVTAAGALLLTLAFWALLPASRCFRPARAGQGALLRHLRDPGLRRLYLMGLVLMAGFVTVYNYLGYRLLAAPFGLPQWLTGLVFLMYLAGTFSSPAAGSLADRVGRRPVMYGSFALAAAGLLATMPDTLPVLGLGLLLFTAGFFAAHSVASGWVGRRAVGGKAQASALYLFAYYAGSSLGGSAGGLAYEHGRWPATVGYGLVLLAVAAVAALRLAEPGARGPRPRRSPDLPLD